MRGTPHPKYEFVAMIVVLAIVVIAPWSGSRLVVYGLTVTAIYAIVVASLNLLLGLAGQVSFAQTAFMAVGGYGSALLTTRLAVNGWEALVLAALLSAIAAIAVGRPLLRLRGHYLAMATFALALGVYSFAGAAPLTNGGIGISDVPPLRLGAVTFDNPLAFYWLSWAACAAATATFYLLANSRFGRAWRALATGQDIAASLGIDVPGYKLLAFTIAAFMASIAGSLYVEFTSFAGPDLYDVSIVLNIFLMLFIGGRGSVMGPIIGAALMVFLPQSIAGLGQLQNLIFFVVLLAVILVWPSGLLGRSEESSSLAALVPRWLLRRDRSWQR